MGCELTGRLMILMISETDPAPQYSMTIWKSEVNGWLQGSSVRARLPHWLTHKSVFLK